MYTQALWTIKGEPQDLSPLCPTPRTKASQSRVRKLLLLKAKRPTFSLQATQSRHNDSTLSLRLESSQTAGE